MAKRISLVVYIVIFVAFWGTGFNIGVEENLITSAFPFTNIFFIDLVIFISLAVFGLVLLPVRREDWNIDLFKPEALTVQAIRPLLSGFALGLAYQTSIWLLGSLAIHF